LKLVVGHLIKGHFSSLLQQPLNHLLLHRL
jgi:hypothetical protein